VFPKPDYDYQKTCLHSSMFEYKPRYFYLYGILRFLLLTCKINILILIYS